MKGIIIPNQMILGLIYKSTATSLNIKLILNCAVTSLIHSLCLQDVESSAGNIWLVVEPRYGELPTEMKLDKQFLSAGAYFSHAEFDSGKWCI